MKRPAVLPDELPALSHELIRILDEVYPPRCPGLGDLERDIFHYVGQRSVVEALLARIEEKEKNETEENVWCG